MRRLLMVAGALCVSACTLLLGFEEGRDRSSSSGQIPTDGGGEAGELVTGSVAVSPARLDFGTLGCGDAPPAPRTVTLKNLAAAPLKYSAELRGSANFSITGAPSGEIAGGGSATITIATSVPTGQAAGEILLAAGGELVHVQLLATTGGARLELTPPACDFGKVRVDTEAMPCAVTLANVGASPADVTLPSATAPFTLTWATTPATLAPDASVSGTLGFHPTTATPSTGKFDVATSTKLCGAPASLAASGAGSNDPVVLQPGKLDFGNMPCGTTPPPKTVSIQNFNPSQITYTPVLTSGASFTTSGGGTVAPDGGATITVSPKLVPSTPPGPVSDVLTVTTNGPGDSPHAIPISATTQGSVLAFTAVGIVLSSGETRSFSLANTGNAAVTVTLSMAPTNGPEFVLLSPLSPQVLPAGGSLTGEVMFDPPGAGTFTGKLRVSATGPQCVSATPLGLAGTK